MPWDDGSGLGLLGILASLRNGIFWTAFEDVLAEFGVKRSKWLMSCTVVMAGGIMVFDK